MSVKPRGAKHVDRPAISNMFGIVSMASKFGVYDSCFVFMFGEKAEYGLWLMEICLGHLWIVLEDEGLVKKNEDHE